VYPREQGERLARKRGWATVRDGDGLRRAVPSPAPRRIVQLPAIRRLLDAGVIVVCGGGGGIPVAAGTAGRFHGVDAVIDKDHTAALLAEGVGADGLLLLTDTPGVYEGFGTRAERLIRTASPEELGAHAFAAGSMGPKVEAACRFVARTGAWAAIGALGDAASIVAGTAGTLISLRPAAQKPNLTTVSSTTRNT
jgi:carbamate kinase